MTLSTTHRSTEHVAPAWSMLRESIGRDSRRGVLDTQDSCHEEPCKVCWGAVGVKQVCLAQALRLQPG